MHPLVPIRDYTKGIIRYLCKGTQISEAERLANSYFEVLGEKPPTKN